MTSDGINPSAEKISAIRDSRSSNNAGEISSFMALMQYSPWLMPDLALVARPIQVLKSKDVKFVRGQEQQTVFERLTKMIIHPNTLAYQKVNCRTKIIADASSAGLVEVHAQY